MTVLEEVRVPQESANDEFARVVALHVESRALVEVGTRLVDVETSKTVLEIESTTAG
jgi:pyruvate/2-oxoglutarate dehydrogenase complex dihydrolipoamide acyltransferase (E2) component